MRPDPYTEPARVDRATGFGILSNLRTAARATIAAAERSGHAVSVAVVELPVVDDEFVRSMSLALRATIRDTDQCFRIDESLIVVILPMAASRTVAGIMERAACLTDRDFAWGVATTDADGRTIDLLVARAATRMTHFTASSLR